MFYLFVLCFVQVLDCIIEAVNLETPRQVIHQFYKVYFEKVPYVFFPSFPM